MGNLVAFADDIAELNSTLHSTNLKKIYGMANIWDFGLHKTAWLSVLSRIILLVLLKNIEHSRNKGISISQDIYNLYGFQKKKKKTRN